MTKIEALELELAARKMVDGTELDWWKVIKFGSVVCECAPCFLAQRYFYELALGIIEGKPAFEGDKHFDSRGECYIACGKYTQAYLDTCSWNPPKPKTVMIELPYQSAVNAVEKEQVDYVGYFAACRKALEEMK